MPLKHHISEWNFASSDLLIGKCISFDWKNGNDIPRGSRLTIPPLYMHARRAYFFQVQYQTVPLYELSIIFTVVAEYETLYSFFYVLLYNHVVIKIYGV